MRGIYIHIPFCNEVCIYCDFTKMVTKLDNKIKYIDRLLEEIDNNISYFNDIDTIYIGGGTPNSLPLNLLEKLLIKLNPYLDKTKENSIELNPELINDDLLILLKKYNFNRLSIGVESFNDDILKLIRRKYDKNLVFDKIKLAKYYGFDNINIDLIFGLPGQTLNDIIYDLNYFKDLNINHLSYYDLILEDKTILNNYINMHKCKLLDDELLADMYDYINKFMYEAGYNHYEISNYAKEGFESIHNLKYWSEEEYLGLGLGASSFINNYRIKNKNKLIDYFNEFIDTKEFINEEEEKKEFVMLGLRKLKGISISEYNKRYHSDILNDFNFKKFIINNIIIIDNDYIKIKEDKMFISNLIIGELI